MLSSFDIKYEGIAKFPGSTRDLSLVVDKEIFVGQIEEVIKKCGGKLLVIDGGFSKAYQHKTGARQARNRDQSVIVDNHCREAACGVDLV